MLNEYYFDLFIKCLTLAVIAEAVVEALKLPIAIIKRLTGLRRVKPFDCGFCMAFWIALFYWKLDLTGIAGVILFRQIINRLLLF